MEWAVAMQYPADNPCGRIGPVLGPQQDHMRHTQALPVNREALTLIGKNMLGSRSMEITQEQYRQ